jgi:hypothetical protein
MGIIRKTISFYEIELEYISNPNLVCFLCGTTPLTVSDFFLYGDIRVCIKCRQATREGQVRRIKKFKRPRAIKWAFSIYNNIPPLLIKTP